MSIANIITALGWGAVNSITGAQTLSVVSNDSLSLAVGIVIMALMSMVVSFVGYKWIHIYERYSWIPVFIAYCIVAGVGAKYYIPSSMVISVKTMSSYSLSQSALKENFLLF
jgi:purine-cytosine permease-like protein